MLELPPLGEDLLEVWKLVGLVVVLETPEEVLGSGTG